MLGTKLTVSDGSSPTCLRGSAGQQTTTGKSDVALKRYTGLSPMRVSKDAKYSVTFDDQIRLDYWYGPREKVLFTTGDHPRLGRMVNDVKRALTDGRPGGAFYINEYGDVLVPDGQGGACYWAGHYDESLEFKDEELTVSPVAPAGLE